MPPSTDPFGSSGSPTAVAAVEAIQLRIPLAADAVPGARLWGAPLRAADVLLVRLTTRDGVEGWGEAFGFSAAAPGRTAIDEVIAPLLIGRDATDIGSVMAGLHRALHVFGRGGVVGFALSAIDIALWDIAGKLAGLPVSRLLGGGPPDLPCYASLACYSDPEPVAAAVGAAREAGFDTIKLHESRRDAIRAAREYAGPEAGLIVDAGCAWSLPQARSMASELAEVGVLCVEEPLWPPENFTGLAELRRTTGVPVAAGENVATLMEFDRMLGSGAVDFAQPSPAKLGGISALVEAFPLAAVHNAAVLTHSFYDGPGLLAAAHVAAALGGPAAMIEWRRFELVAAIYGEAELVRNGRIRVPDGPGLGLDPDPDVVAAYRR